MSTDLRSPEAVQPKETTATQDYQSFHSYAQSLPTPPPSPEDEMWRLPPLPEELALGEELTKDRLSYYRLTNDLSRLLATVPPSNDVEAASITTGEIAACQAKRTELLLRQKQETLKALQAKIELLPKIAELITAQSAIAAEQTPVVRESLLTALMDLGVDRVTANGLVQTLPRLRAVADAHMQWVLLGRAYATSLRTAQADLARAQAALDSFVKELLPSS